jgi:hypothetical protein
MHPTRPRRARRHDPRALRRRLNRRAAQVVADDPEVRRSARAALEDWRPSRRSRHLARRMLRAELVFRRWDDLPREAGVYLITAGDGASLPRTGDCYVGLSGNIAARVHRGHLRRGGTRADALIATATGAWISAAEITKEALPMHEARLYLLARAAGLTPRNASWSLGRRSRAQPDSLVSCRLDDGRLMLHDGREAAIRDLGLPIGATGISAVIAGHQRVVAGHLFRLAEPSERLQGVPSSQASDAMLTPEGRLHWRRGGVPEALRRQLATHRAPYRRRSEGGLVGVTFEPRSKRWQARYREGPASGGALRSIGATFPTAQAANAAIRAFAAAHPEITPFNPSWEKTTTSPRRRRSR